MAPLTLALARPRSLRHILRMTDTKPPQPVPAAADADTAATPAKPPQSTRPKEIGGPAGPEPTRYGDWERKGRCFDF